MRLPRPAVLALLVTLALLAGMAAPASAQFYYLSQNKIQYRRLDWQVLKGPRVDVYYYPAEAGLAPVALAYAEESYDVLALKFGHTVTTRIPLIIYASHADFEQTNVLPFTPPEGLLGVTDFLKRRVTLPFRGNLAEFRHTLRHEMVHVFQLSLLSDRFERSPQAAGVPLPLWFTEGLAELWSGGEDARDEMIMRDLVISGRLPGPEQLACVTGGIVYPLGGRVHRWLVETYGDWRVAQLYRELWRYHSFEDAIGGGLRPDPGGAERGVPGGHAAPLLPGGGPLYRAAGAGAATAPPPRSSPATPRAIPGWPRWSTRLPATGISPCRPGRWTAAKRATS